MKNIQDYLRHFLQTVPTSKMLQLLLFIDATFEYFKQGADNPSKMSFKKLRCIATIYLLKYEWLVQIYI